VIIRRSTSKTPTPQVVQTPSVAQITRQNDQSMTEIPKEIFVLPAVAQRQQEPESGVPQQEVETPNDILEEKAAYSPVKLLVNVMARNDSSYADDETTLIRQSPSPCRQSPSPSIKSNASSPFSPLKL
jgi:hypothetical protein